MKTPFRACLPGLTRVFGMVALLLLASLALAAGNDAETAPPTAGCNIPVATDNKSAAGRERYQQELVRANKGKTIDAIRFRNVNVFDESKEEENNSLYRFLNRLHVHTLKDVVASQLLFEPGDQLNPDIVAESERLLRGRNYLANAYITVSQVCANSVELTVYTQDAWTTEPQLSFGHTGGETSSGFGLAEGNFLGSGNSLSVGYRKDADRSGVSYYFSSPHFLNSRLAARLGYSDNSDGEDSVVDIAYPFYSLKTPVSYGVRSEKLTQLEPIRFKGEEVDEFRHNIERHEIYYGRAINVEADYTHRLIAGITKERDTFSETVDTVGDLPRNVELLYPWLEYQFIENEFSVYRNINQIQRTEDVAMGKEITLRIGYGADAWNNADDVLRYSGSFSDMVEVDENHITRFAAYVESKRHSRLDGLDTVVAGGELSYYYLSDRNNRWYARLRYDIGRDLQIHEKLAVGGEVGVRGYPLDFQRGDQRYIFSLERRYFSDIHLFNLFRLGAVAFFDAGRAWGSDTPEASPQHLSNVGLGLRISSSKARIGHVIHIDVAFPTSDRQDADSVQWLIKAEQTF